MSLANREEFINYREEAPPTEKELQDRKCAIQNITQTCKFLSELTEELEEHDYLISEINVSSASTYIEIRLQQNNDYIFAITPRFAENEIEVDIELREDGYPETIKSEQGDGDSVIVMLDNLSLFFETQISPDDRLEERESKHDRLLKFAE